MKAHWNALFAVAILIGWDLDQERGHLYRDVLEVRYGLDQPWQEVTGPYRLNENLTRYEVVLPNEGRAFFRVRRWWGEPWI